MSLRVVEVIPSLVIGGAEVFAVQLAQALREAGHDAKLLVLKHAGPLEARLGDLAPHTAVLGKRSRWDASVLFRATRQLQAWKPDVVHTHLFTALSWGTVAAQAARVPVRVHTQHAVHDDEYAYLPWIRRGLSGLVDTVVGCSPAVVDDIARRRLSPLAPTCVIENGIPLAGRPTSTLDGDPLRLVSLGRLVPIKGQRHLIDAVALLRARGVAVHLTLGGEGELRDALQQQIHALDLGDRVRLAGQVDAVPAFLASADLFVLPSLSEAMPISLLEAAAAGLPLLVTASGGAPRLIEAGAGGDVVPPGDAEALAAAIARVAALPVEARRALGARSRALVLARYDIAATAAAYADLFHRLRGP